MPSAKPYGPVKTKERLKEKEKRKEKNNATKIKS